MVMSGAARGRSGGADGLFPKTMASIDGCARRYRWAGRHGRYMYWLDGIPTHERREIPWVFFLVRRRGRHPVVSVTFVGVFPTSISSAILYGPTAYKPRVKSLVHGSSGSSTPQGWS
jgi:nitrate reductase NapE component